MGEDKHQYDIPFLIFSGGRILTDCFPSDWKRKVTTINHNDIEKALLLRENLQQTIYFILAEVFCDSDSILSTQVERIHCQCLNLLKVILSHSE